jgi:hypothetical protein
MEGDAPSRGRCGVAFVALVAALAAGIAQWPPPQGYAAISAGSPWKDRAVVERRFAEALDAVEKETGLAYAVRPAVRVSDRATVAKVVRTELRDLAAFRDSPRDLDAAVEFASRVLVAKYEPGAHVVHVVPETADTVAKALRSPALAAEGTLRVVLVHEAVHALDFPRYGLEAARRRVANEDEGQAFGAVVEGHAQAVAKRVAAKWGLVKSFDEYTRSISAMPPGVPPEVEAIVRALAATLAFGYVQGQAFVEAVEAARPGGVEAVLRDPPRSTRLVERPEEWLDPTKVPTGPDLAAAADAFRSLVPAPEWTARSARILKAALETTASAVPEARRKEYLKGLEDARALAASASGGRQVLVYVIAFATEADARRHVDIERVTSTAKDRGTAPKVVEAKYSDGAGAGNLLPGFVATKTVESGKETAELVAQTFAAGRFAAQVVVVGAPELTRERQDEAIAALLVVLDVKPPKPPPAKPKPPPPPKGSRPVRIEVLDPDGIAVPRANVKATWGDKSIAKAVRKGEVTLDLPPEKVTLVVTDPENEDREPLEFGPADPVEVGPDETDATVRFKKP